MREMMGALMSCATVISIYRTNVVNILFSQLLSPSYIIFIRHDSTISTDKNSTTNQRSVDAVMEFAIPYPSSPRSDACFCMALQYPKRA